MLNEKIEFDLPGTIDKGFRLRGARDYRLDAQLNLEEFTAIIINLVLQHNQRWIKNYPREQAMIKDGVRPIPIEMWKWGVQHKKGGFFQEDLDTVRLNLLPRGNARILRNGIVFKGLYYSSQEFIEERWHLTKQGKSVSVAYDERDMNVIYIPTNGGRECIRCYMLRKSSMSYANLSYWEIIFQQRLESDMEIITSDEESQIYNDINGEIDKIVDASAKDKKEEQKSESLSNKKRLENIHKNRQDEKLRYQARQAFRIGTTDEVIDIGYEDDEEEFEVNRHIEFLKKFYSEGG